MFGYRRLFNMEDSRIENYLDFVQTNVQLLKDSANLIKEDTILPYRINACIAQYVEVALMLNSEYQRKKWEHKELTREYAKWWDKKFLMARDKLNSERTSSKFASQKEIESQTRVDNESEYEEWQEKLDACVAQSDFLIRQIDIWKKQDQLLITLSNNMRTEMRALSIDDRIDRREPPRRKLADEGTEN
jgi:hypothetical protein